MSGHSKWSTIKRKKEKTDGARAKVFTKIGRELAVAVREGGSADPNVNSKLKDCIAKAKANNVPNENIERIIKRLPARAIQITTNQSHMKATVQAVLHLLLKHLPITVTEQLATSVITSINSVEIWVLLAAFPLCSLKKGVILIESEGLEEDTVMEDALDAGAADFSAEDGVFEIQTEPDDFSAVRDALEEKGYTFVSAEVEMVPSTYTKLTDEEAITKMQRLLDVLEDNDDVQNVFHNWEYDEPEEDE